MTDKSILKLRSEMFEEMASGELFAWYQRTKLIPVKEVLPR